MPITVGHSKSVTIADGTNSAIVRPSDWNSNHAVTLNISGTDIFGAFSNAGNVTFGTDTAGYITATAPAGGGGGGAAISAGTQSQSTGTVIFSNSNGVSFGLNAGTLTGSHNGYTGATTQFLTTAQPVGAYLTTARASNDAIGLNTALTANGVSVTANSSGLSLNFPAFLTTAANSTHSHGNPTLNLTNLSGTTASNSAGFTLSLSAAAPGGGAGTLSVGVYNNTTVLDGNTTVSIDPGIVFYGAGNVSVGIGSTGTGAGPTGIIISGGGGGAGDGWNEARFTNSTANSTMPIVWAGNSGGSGNVTMGLTGSTVTMSAPSGGGGGYTAFTFQNRQLGASTTINSVGGQNSLWLAPTRVAAPISASTILAAIISYSGTITSAASAQMGQTLRVGIWSQHTDPASTTQFGQYWTGNASMTFWNSGTSSYSYAYSLAGGQTTGSSAGSNLGTASVMGVRQIIMPIGSTMTTGLYIMGILNSTSSAGYSAAMSRAALYMDNPMSIGQGTFGSATNSSMGYQDGGRYGTTTASLPSTIALSQIVGVNNVMPFFKIGAI